MDMGKAIREAAGILGDVAVAAVAAYGVLSAAESALLHGLLAGSGTAFLPVTVPFLLREKEDRA